MDKGSTEGWIQDKWCIHRMSWTMHTPEECKVGMAQAQQWSSSHRTASQSQFLPTYLALILQVANLACSSFKSNWSDQKWWFRPVWHYFHVSCAMPKANNTNQTILALYVSLNPNHAPKPPFICEQLPYHHQEKNLYHQSMNLLPQWVLHKAPIQVPLV